MARLRAGDLLYFPGQWWHEVHNRSPTSLAVTNAVAWPSKKFLEKSQEEEKEEVPRPILGKRGKHPGLKYAKFVVAMAKEK